MDFDRQVFQEEGPSFTAAINGHRLLLTVPAVNETLWLGPVADIVYPAAPGVLETSSSAGLDGGMVVIGYYLDAEWKLRQFIATYPGFYVANAAVSCTDRGTGAVIVDAVRTWGLRILAPLVVTGNANVGDVITYIGVAATIQDTVTFRTSQTNYSSTGAKTVPVGFMLLIRGIDSEGPQSASKLAVNIETRANVPDTYAPVAPWVCEAGMQIIIGTPRLGDGRRMFPSPIIIGPTRDVRLTGELEAALSGFGAATVVGTLVPDILFGTKRTASLNNNPGDGIPTRGSIV